MRFGYCCISLLTGRTTNHNCRLESATPEKLRGLIAQNLADLREILRFNVGHGWLLFRIGSSFVPFGSHPINRLRWWKEFKGEFEEIGRFARENAMRLSMHPGQYTVLSSPDREIRKASVAELVYSTRVLDALGLDAQNKVVVHAGGVYGDKATAVERFVHEVERLPSNMRDRLVIENDERSYSAADVLSISRRVHLPVVFDNLHHLANPSPQPLDELLAAVFRTWKKKDGPPKVHFSSQARGERPGKHAELIDPDEWNRWLALWRAAGDPDVMLEAKGKDAALEKAFQISDFPSAEPNSI